MTYFIKNVLEYPTASFPDILKAKSLNTFKCDVCKHEKTDENTRLSFYCADINRLHSCGEHSKSIESITHNFVNRECEECKNKERNIIVQKTINPSSFIIINDPIGAENDKAKYLREKVRYAYSGYVTYCDNFVHAPETINLGLSKYELYAKVCFTRNADGTFMNSYTVAKKGQKWYYFDSRTYKMIKLENSYTWMDQNQNDEEVKTTSEESEVIEKSSGGLYFYRKINQ